MDASLFLLLAISAFLVAGARVDAVTCPGSQVEMSGRCCDRCPDGVAVTAPCTDVTATACGACPAGTYSVWRVGPAPAGNATTPSESWRGGRCAACDACQHGYGVVRGCGGRASDGRDGADGNTVCRRCGNGTFSDVMSATAPCRPCMVCDRRKQIMLQQCNPIQDTICISRNFPGMLPTTTEAPPAAAHRRAEDRANMLPVYLAVLGLVVVGLLAYVVHKSRPLTCFNRYCQPAKTASATTATGPSREAPQQPRASVGGGRNAAAVNSQLLIRDKSNSVRAESASRQTEKSWLPDVSMDMTSIGMASPRPAGYSASAKALSSKSSSASTETSGDACVWWAELARVIDNSHLRQEELRDVMNRLGVSCPSPSANHHQLGGATLLRHCLGTAPPDGGATAGGALARLTGAFAAAGRADVAAAISNLHPRRPPTRTKEHHCSKRLIDIV